MSVDDEVAVSSLLILTDACFDQRCIFQCGESELYIFPNILQRFCTDHAFPIGGIEFRPASVVGNLESSPAAARNAVTKFSTMVGPHRHLPFAEAIVTCGSPKKEDILLSRSHSISDCFGTHLPQPRTASQHIRIRLQL